MPATTETVRSVQTRPRLRPVMFTTLGVLAVIVVAALIFWFVGNQSPRITFDGEATTYSGPTEFEPGFTTFQFEVTGVPEGESFFSIVRLADDSVTFAEIEDWAKIAVPGVFPDFWDPALLKWIDMDPLEREKELMFTEGSWLIVAQTRPDYGNAVHPVTVIKVAAS